MYVPKLVALAFQALAVLPSVSIAASIAVRENVCDAQKRIELAKLAVAAILEPTAAESTAAYEAYPFTPNAQIILNPNEVGDIPVSHDKQSTVGFLAIIYQIVTDVIVDKYANIDDSMTFFNVTGDLGLLHKVPIPAKVFFDVFLTYTLNPCELKIVHVYAQVPSELLGVFIDVATGVSPPPAHPA